MQSTPYKQAFGPCHPRQLYRLHVEQLGPELHEKFHFICFPPIKDVTHNSAINKCGLWSVIWNLRFETF